MHDDDDDMGGAGSLVWHYTDGRGLEGILKNHVLRASSAAYMNDSKELITGNEVLNRIYAGIRQKSVGSGEDLQRLVESFAPPREESFILSASSEPDSLTMWRYYGKDQVSFAIGLDKDVQLSVRGQSSRRRHPHPPKDYLNGAKDDFGTLEEDPDDDMQTVEPWEEMIYGRPQQEKIIKQALEELDAAVTEANAVDGRFPFKLALLKLEVLSQLHRIKHGGFQDERELRISAHVSPAWKYVLHRPGQYGLIPFVELGLPKAKAASEKQDADPDVKQKMNRLPIRQINVGPTPYREEARFGLEQMLSLLGYHDVKVAASSIPYR